MKNGHREVHKSPWGQTGTVRGREPGISQYDFILNAKKHSEREFIYVNLETWKVSKRG